ncbi:hypothetical protein ACIO52_31790 [Nocardia sp. NPDC087230]
MRSSVEPTAGALQLVDGGPVFVVGEAADFAVGQAQLGDGDLPVDRSRDE